MQPATTPFEPGDKVRIVDGPYRGFEGLVHETAPSAGRLQVIVRVHGHHTRLELAFGQVRPL